MTSAISKLSIYNIRHFETFPKADPNWTWSGITRPLQNASDPGYQRWVAPRQPHCSSSLYPIHAFSPSFMLILLWSTASLSPFVHRFLSLLLSLTHLLQAFIFLHQREAGTKIPQMPLPTSKQYKSSRWAGQFSMGYKLFGSICLPQTHSFYVSKPMQHPLYRCFQLIT